MRPLPTEESSHLPVSLVNADFVPASDRKRIRFDDAPGRANGTGEPGSHRRAGLVADNLGDSRKPSG